MRSLKRLITVVLTIAMVLTSVGMVAFADTSFSDITDQKVADAVNKLVAYGIITGYEDGTFRPDNQITRAEFAAIVTRMKGVADNLPTDSVTGFSDLDNDSSRAWARPYVKAAVDLKIINGFEDGTFRAGEPVTYEQAVKMLVCAVGYEVVANSEYNKILVSNPNATWSAGYISAANKHGITKGVITAQITEPASRGVVAVLTSNALEVPELVTDNQGNLTKPEGGNAETESNMTTISGTVTGTFYTGLDTDETGLQEDEITIDATDNDDDGDYTLSQELLAKIDLDEYIGRKVTVYYDNINGEIKSMNLGNTSSTIIDEASIESISASQVKYVDSNGRNQTEDLSGRTFIVNGKYMADYDIANEFTNGTIELFTNAGTKIAKVNSYEVFVVNNYNKTDEKVYLKYAKYNGNNYYQFPTRASDKPVIYVGSAGSSYKETAFSGLSLSQYDVINYLESPSGTAGDPIRKMYVTKGAKSGKVTATLEGEREVEIADQTLYLTQQYYDFAGDSTDEKAPFELSDSYTYYLDYTGQIAAVKYSASTSTGSWNYGYLVEVDTRENQVGILTTTGEYKAYDLKDSVKVDGEKTKASGVFDALEASAEIIDANATDDAELNYYAQPVRYSVSSSKVDAIDTVVKIEGGTDDNFTYDGKLGSAASTSTTRVTANSTETGDATSYAVNSSTLVIYVPDDRSDYGSYAVMKPSSAFAVSANRLVEVFAVDATSSNKLAKLVLVYGTNPTLNFTGNSPYMIVTKVRSDGNTETIEGYIGTSDTTDSVKVSEDKFETEIGTTKGLVNGSDVQAGDIIRYIKDNSGDIVAIQMIYDASIGGGLAVGENGTFADTELDDIIIKYGTANSKDSTDNTIDILCNEVSKTYKIGSTNFFKLSNGDVTASVIDEVTVADDGGDASTIILISRSSESSSNPSAAVIYIIE